MIQKLRSSCGGLLSARTSAKHVKTESRGKQCHIDKKLILAVMQITFALTVGSTIHFQEFFKSYMYGNSQNIPLSTCKNVQYTLIFFWGGGEVTRDEICFIIIADRQSVLIIHITISLFNKKSNS